jgi:AcrR family transcriptional regulator
MTAETGAGGRRRARLSPDQRRAALVAAACACLARGGLRDFTVDKVIAEAGVSRGLIAHHFGTMEGLLVAVYARLYGDWFDGLTAPVPGQTRIAAMIEALVSPRLFDRGVQTVWLTLWGEIATNAALRDEHRRQYAAYRRQVVEALAEAAAGRPLDAEALATAFICLTDGFAVQRCVEPSLLSEEAARAACWALIGPHLGQVTAKPASAAPQTALPRATA